MSDYILEADNLTFSYDKTGAPSLDGLSLRVRRGSRTAVMGANGSGKSTFFLCCNGLLKPDGGRLLYDGVPLSYRKRDLLALREKVGIVFQDPDTQLFSASVYQEISFGPLNLGLSEEEAAREVEAVIGRLGIGPFRHRPAHALSGGQKKQVALADILVMHPELLILDEPFAALDPGHARIIRDMIGKPDQEPGRVPAAILLATHDTDFALEWADEVILMKDGRALAQGPARKILTDRQLLAKAELALPSVIRIFESLRACGMLSADLPAPGSFDQLEAYIRRAGGEA